LNLNKILSFSIGPIASAAVGLITVPIIAWLFSPEDIGRLSMLQVVVSFSLLLFSLGLDQAYVREYHEVIDKPALLKAVFLPGWLMLLAALITLALYPLSVSQLLFGIDSILLTGFLVSAVLLSFLSRFMSLILRMQERGLAYSMSQLLPKILFLGVVLSYVLFDVKAVFENLMMANTFSLFAVFLVFVWNTRKELSSALVSSIDKTKQNYMIRYAMPLIGSGVAFWGLTAMDKFFLRGLSTFHELGVYSVALSFASVALVFQAIFSVVWVPVVYKWAAEGEDPNKIKKVIAYVSLAVTLIWSVAGMFSWAVAWILPHQYEKVQYILLVTMAYPLLYTLSEATGVGIGIKRKTQYSLLAAIFALIVNMIGNYFLIPVYGAAGAAIASALAFLLFFVVKTEASARLWVTFPRFKMYGIILLLVSLSISLNLIKIPFSMILGGYFAILLIGLLLYKQQAFEGCELLVRKYKK